MQCKDATSLGRNIFQDADTFERFDIETHFIVTTLTKLTDRATTRDVALNLLTRPL